MTEPRAQRSASPTGRTPAASAAGAPHGPPPSPGRPPWRRLRESPLALLGGGLLGCFYLLALLAPFVAPYPQEEMDRARFYQPPHRLRWIDADGRWHARPFVHPLRLVDPRRFGYQEDPSRTIPVRLFVPGAPYRLFGLVPARIHLFGVDSPDRVYLLGSDAAGRDVLSRALFGAQISLTVGLVGIAISFALGLLLGGVSGYLGGWVDTLIMRSTELLLSIPTLYLIIALRAIVPVRLPSQAAYLAIVAILALIGWAGLARVIRGLVMSIKRNEYVIAAEALGMSRARIIVRHILPNTASFVIVAATVAVPGYILGEVVLSYFGVGVQEPAASWGNMLRAASSVGVLGSFPWLLLVPGSAIFLTVMAFNFLGDGLRDALDPRRAAGGRAG
jgi:peptide/nickel transport system permease protein